MHAHTTSRSWCRKGHCKAANEEGHLQAQVEAALTACIFLDRLCRADIANDLRRPQTAPSHALQSTTFLQRGSLEASIDRAKQAHDADATACTMYVRSGMLRMGNRNSSHAPTRPWEKLRRTICNQPQRPLTLTTTHRKTYLKPLHPMVMQNTVDVTKYSSGETTRL